MKMHPIKEKAHVIQKNTFNGQFVKRSSRVVTGPPSTPIRKLDNNTDYNWSILGNYRNLLKVLITYHQDIHLDNITIEKIMKWFDILEAYLKHKGSATTILFSKECRHRFLRYLSGEPELTRSDKI